MRKEIIAASAAIALSCTTVSGAQDITVNINNKEVDFSAYDNAMPYIENDRVMIPIRAIAEGLGAEVVWNPDDETIRIDGDILLEINNDIAWVGDEKYILDSPAVLRQSRTYIPLRFVSESLGAKVEWVNEDRAVNITSDRIPAETETSTEPTSETTTVSEKVEETQEKYNGVVYLGIEGYGTLSKEVKDSYKHKFFVNGKTESYTVLSDPAYSIQNKLAEGYIYDINIQNGMITSAEQAAPVSNGRIISSENGILAIENDKNTHSGIKLYNISSSAGKVSVDEISPEVNSTVNIYKNGSAYLVSDSRNYFPPVSGISGVKTLKNFIATAMTPVGHTLYIYGGGWNWQDDGSSIQAVSIGLPQTWSDFFEKNNANYTYRTETGATTYYPHNGVNQYYYAGADCSGYVGWAIYNTLNTQSGNAGYVMASTKMAKTLAQEYNYGTWTQDIHKEDFRPGDIMSMNGHVWIYLGSCDDGSAVIMHSTPSDSKNGMPGGGVQLSALGSEDSRAYELVKKYMVKFYPDWSLRYFPKAVGYNSYTGFEGENAGRFSWDLNGVLTDPENYAAKNAEEILTDLFGE